MVAKPILVALVIFFSSGFNLLNSYRWDISKEEPTIWIKFDADELTSGFSQTVLADGSDPFGDLPKAQQEIAAVQAIIDDFNSIATSYLRLAFYPDDSVDTGDYPSQDTAFSEAAALNRTITVVIGNTAHFGGFASSETSGGFTSSCQITLAGSDDAQTFVATLTHEIGHCLGLAHNHADVDSIMGYNNRPNYNSLGVDDRMGITFQYPSDDEYANEQPNLGLACTPR